MNEDISREQAAAPQIERSNKPALTGAFELLKGALAFYKDNLWRLVGIVFVLPLAGFLGALFAAMLSDNLRIFVVVSMLMILLLTPLVTLALIYAIKSGAGIKEAYKYAFSNFFSYLWLSALVTGTLIGGTVMGLIPGLIFAVWFFPAIFIFVDQSGRGLGAMMKAKEYVRGYWMAAASLLVALILVSILISFLIAPFAFMGEVSLEIAQFVVELFFFPFSMVYYWLIYRELVAVKPDLAQATVPSKGKGFFIFSAVLGFLVLSLYLAFGYFLLTTEQEGLPMSEEFNLDDFDLGPADLEAIQVE